MRYLGFALVAVLMVLAAPASAQQRGITISAKQLEIRINESRCNE